MLVIIGRIYRDQFISKRKNNLRQSYRIFRMYMKFRKVWNNSELSLIILKYFCNDWLRKTLLLKYIKDLVSDHPSAVKNESQKLLKSVEKHFYSTFSSFCTKLIWRKSFLVRSAILGLLVNTPTAKYKYSHNNRENLTLPIQMQLSKKSKSICCNFVEFLEFSLNLENLEKKLNLIT